MQKEESMMGNIKAVSGLAVSMGMMMSACVSVPTPEEQEQTYLALSDQHFVETLNVVDDPLNPSIEIDTKAGYDDSPQYWGPQDDQFLRANVFRDTGNISVQGYVSSQTVGDAIRGQSVRFEHTLKDREVDRIGVDVSCTVTNCLYYEGYVFSIAPDELASAIAEAETRGERTLVFRIQGQSGKDYDGRFHIGEAKAILGAIEQRSSQ